MSGPPRLDSLPAIERACWQGLAAAVQDAGHPWRTMTLATVAGDRADARTIVLRDVDDARRGVVFYTDARSAKVAQIGAVPHGVLVGWWPERGWQLRLRVAMQVHTDGLDVSSRWARVQLSPSSGADYLSTLPPGTPVDRFEPERASRAHFAIVVATVDQIDWLELHPDGHRRARIDGERSTWLTP
jgi:hypothetical protein